MKILIADDSSVSRHSLEATLRKWGYEVQAASDGTQAWAMLQAPDAPPIAILDWMMPGFSGVEVCRKIREHAREPYTYVLLLTARGEHADLIEGMEAGADDYVIKPFDQNELNVRLRAGKRLVELQSELLSAREALREQATKDSLTRLWNRSFIYDTMTREMARTDRESSPLGVLLVDLDHFKAVNDTYGHAAGDIVLCEAARRMQASVRTYDWIGRYGGEEFLVLLPGCDAEQTQHEAERLRTQLSKEPIALASTALTLTASFGAITAYPNGTRSAETLIRKADEALYQAKRLGRNRVVMVTDGAGERIIGRHLVEPQTIAI